MPALFRRFTGGKPAASPFRTRLSAEPLEDRTVPATFTVTDLGDAGAGTLRDAVDQANANPGADDIVFAVTGTIALTSGQIDINDDLTITGGGAIVLDGGGAQRIFDINGATTLTGLTLRNGFVTGEAGGAVLVDSGENLTVRDSTFSGNTADEGGAVFASGYVVVRLSGTTFSGNTAAAEDGGAISAVNSAILEIENSTFSGNTTPTDDGGAVYLDRALGFVVRGSTFTGNSAASEDGGAIAVERMRGNVLIENSTLTGNTAGQEGGALYLGRQYLGYTITLANVVVTGNAAGNDGGGIYAEDIAGTLRIVASRITGNEADNDGGGIEVSSLLQTSVVEVVDSDISGNTAGDDGGGLALYLDEGSVTITDSTITGNTAANDGGGLWLYYEDDSSILTSLTIVGSDISGNTAGDDGGGVYIAFYDAVAYGNFTFRDTTISGNTAGGVGGGVQFELFTDSFSATLVGTLVFDGVTITGNTADEGGGIDLTGGGFVNPVVVANSNISGNTATGSDGGGLDIYGAFYGGIQVTNTTIAGNTAGDDGGGFWFSGGEGGTLTFDNSTISGNIAAGDGGGVYLYSDDSTVVFRNSTVSGNTATTGNGGGIYIRDIDENARIENSTIAFNAAPAGIGGGVFQAAGNTNLSSSIVSGNSAATGNDLGGNGVYFDARFSLVGDTTVGGTMTLSDLGSNLFGVDPLLAPLADNGGPTFTHAIAPGSPALDAGFNFAASQFDQRGNPFLRTSGAGTDIGAFEYNPPPPVPPLPIVAGAGAGGNGTFVAYNPDGTVKATVEAFDPSVTGGVRVAVGDVTGDGVFDYIAGAGPGAPSVVKVFDGVTLQPVAFFLVYETTFTGGVYVASGDIDGDGFAEVVVTPDQGGGPVVAVYSGKSLAGGNAVEIARFNGIQDPEFRGGARVAVGDVTGDGFADIVVAAGFQGGPRISVWESAAVLAGRTTAADTPFANFFAFEDALRNGTFVAVGDLDGDGFGDIIAGAGPDGAPRVVVFDGADLVAGSLTMTASFFAGDNEDRIGVPVAVADFNADGDLDVVTGVGEPDAGAAGTAVSVVRVYPASSLGNDPLDPLATLTPFADFTGGVFVG